MNGVINVYKEAGYTSFDVVARLRGILKTKKIGHTGTLDPDAAGVLPVCVGNATKICELITDWDKEYVATLRLGVSTDTYDMSGKIIAENKELADKITSDEFNNILNDFRGGIEQIPPMYSAIKVNGKRLYELAREGVTIERKKRRVNIKELTVLSEHSPLYEMRIVCSKGTYIRSLCNDIGDALLCGGTMESLLRTRVGDFRIEDALKLSEIENLVSGGSGGVLGCDGALGRNGTAGLHNMITPVDEIFKNYEKLSVDKRGEKALLNGNMLPLSYVNKEGADTFLKRGSRYRIYNCDGVFCGIYELNGNNMLRAYKMFL